MDKVSKSVWPHMHFHRIIHTEEKVFSVTFVDSVTKSDGCPYLTLKVIEKVSVLHASCADLFGKGKKGKCIPELITST
jgi:hypothetical protein